MLTISDIKERISPILQKYDVKEAFIFGSYARNEANENSDIDIRIEKGNSRKLDSLIAEGGFYVELKEALGNEIDLVTSLPTGPLSKYFIDNLKKDEVRIYECSK